MTTIAFDGETIAYDGRVTQGGTIVSDDYDKKYKYGNTYFFLSGNVNELEEFIEACIDGGSENSYNCSGFMYENGELYEVGGGNGVWICRNVGPMAYGSGADHAITAMDCGLSAKEAVKMAAKRDIYTGGKIRTFKINWGN